MPFVKLDTETLNSSLWVSDWRTRITFLTMLMLARPNGFVAAKAPGIARAAVLPLEDVRRALVELESPDPDSRSENNDGRRIETVEGGYRIINYTKYRDKDHTHAERQRRYRERQRERENESQQASPSVTEQESDASQPSRVTQAEAEAYTNLSTPDGVEGDGKPPPCPHEKILALYREICVPAGMTEVRVWNDKRCKFLRARWRENPKHQSLDFWRRYFEHCADSRFLTGQAEPRKDQPPFVADLEWIIRPSNFAKIVEGKYHRG